jgi:uncharacterized RDD family membrane protein YckC
VNCPACSEALVKGQDRCPRCGTVVFLPVEGALAPDPRLTPSPRHEGNKGEPMREIPGLKKRERTWKDEVRDRVRDRRQRRSGSSDLPLFREDEDAPDAVPAETEAAEAAPGIRELGGASDLAVDDLPLRPLDPVTPPPARTVPPPPRPSAPPPARALESTFEEEPEEEWPVEPTQRPEALRPVERPARFAERVGAAAVDVVLLLGLFAVVVYFAGRAAHVAVPALRPAWPFLAGYLAFLGLVYAGYFTGTTGQTVGKIVAGLRVVDAAGHPPGFLKALLRAAMGSAGVAMAGLGAAPMLLDPAGRGLHDRLVKTRVVKF